LLENNDFLTKGEETVEWKLIPSLKRYEASNTGLIRNAKTLQILKFQNDIHGYYILTCRPEPKHQVNVRVHRAVAEAFLGKCPDGLVVNHKDGNKKNNNIENLEYITSSENNQHAYDIGLKVANMDQVIKKGDEHYNSQITEQQAIEILKFHYRTGFGCRKVAKFFGVSRGVTGNLLANRSWKHIRRDLIKIEVEKENELCQIA